MAILLTSENQDGKEGKCRYHAGQEVQTLEVALSLRL